MSQNTNLTYDFVAPAKIMFGWGRRAELGNLCAPVGTRAWVVWGSRTLERSFRADEIRNSLAAAGLQPLKLATISREPHVTDVDEAAATLRQRMASGDFVMAIGGGSAIDLAKAVAAMAAADPDTSVKDYLEGVGRNLQLSWPPLPFVAVPTTAGTGSEATKNAVISSREPLFKKSLRSESMLPRAVLVDPELTVSLPPKLTAYTGMDAITQLIESYISRRRKPIPQALAISGLQLAVPSLENAVNNGAARPAREAMAQAALLSGMALANSGLGLAHGVAAALGAHHDVPHGLACAVMLPIALCLNRDVCVAEYAELATALGLANCDTSRERAADAFMERIEQLCTAIGIPGRLGSLGVARADVSQLARGSHGNSMDGNPRAIADDELERLLEENL